MKALALLLASVLAARTDLTLFEKICIGIGTATFWVGGGYFLFNLWVHYGQKLEDHYRRKQPTHDWRGLPIVRRYAQEDPPWYIKAAIMGLGLGLLVLFFALSAWLGIELPDSGEY